MNWITNQSMFVLQCICIVSVLPISQYLSRHKKQPVCGANHHQLPCNNPTHLLQHINRYTSSMHLLHTFSVRALPVAEAKILDHFYKPNIPQLRDGGNGLRNHFWPLKRSSRPRLCYPCVATIGGAP